MLMMRNKAVLQEEDPMEVGKRAYFQHYKLSINLSTNNLLSEIKYQDA
jgi:hypothetical protein